MSVLQTQLNSRSADFLANAAALQVVVDDLRVQLKKSAAGGGEKARAKHVARGKLPPRERVQMLLDPGTPFLELAPLAAHAMYLNKEGMEDAPCAGMIAGIGRVNGVDCSAFRAIRQAATKFDVAPSHPKPWWVHRQSTVRVHRPVPWQS